MLNVTIHYNDILIGKCQMNKIFKIKAVVFNQLNTSIVEVWNFFFKLCFVYFRLMCECIINSEYLVYTNSEFWIECFHIIKSILSTVDYKGVREIMKVKII